MNIKLLRTILGKTQTEFANDLGIPQNTLSNYETEKRKPPYILLKKMTVLYKVPIDFLMSTDDIADDRLADALHDERIRRGLTITELAKETNIPQNYLKSCEDGSVPMSAYVLSIICSYYGKSIERFYYDHNMFDEHIPEHFNGDVDRYIEFKRAVDKDYQAEHLQSSCISFFVDNNLVTELARAKELSQQKQKILADKFKEAMSAIDDELDDEQN